MIYHIAKIIKAQSSANLHTDISHIIASTAICCHLTAAQISVVIQ